MRKKNCILINLLSNQHFISAGQKKNQKLMERKKQVDFKEHFADIPVKHVFAAENT
jgi:hypothetical protein